MKLQDILNKFNDQVNYYEIEEDDSDHERKECNKTLYEKYVIKSIGDIANTNKIAEQILDTIYFDIRNRNDYLVKFEGKDTYLKALMMKLLNKMYVVDKELFEIRNKLGIEIDNYIVSKKKKSNIMNYLLSDKSLDAYSAHETRKYIALYFNTIVIIVDQKGVILEASLEVDEMNEDTDIVILVNTGNKFEMLSSDKEYNITDFNYLLEKLLSWNKDGGELILSLYNKKPNDLLLKKISIMDMRNICEKYMINLTKKSDRTLKNIKKNKKELYMDLKHYFGCKK
jgi:hypothetical protein